PGLQPGPEETHGESEDDDEDGIGVLNEAGRHIPSEQAAVCLVVGDEGERGARLFETRPEEYYEESYRVEHKDAVALNFRDGFIGEDQHRKADTGSVNKWIYPYFDGVL